MSDQKDLIHEELLELLKIVHAEEIRLERRITTKEENTLLITLIETHGDELLLHVRKHLKQRRTA